MRNFQRNKTLTREDFALFFNGDKLFTCAQSDPFLIPVGEIYCEQSLPAERDYFYLGKYYEKNVFAIAIKAHNFREKIQCISVRDILKTANTQASQLICKGKQLLHWHRSSLYSGCCGSLTTLSQVETAKICQDCNSVIYPATFPAIIVLVEKGRHILLARSAHFPSGMYSVLAGFVETGESCEEAVYREIAEEVGIRIKDMTYFASQPWPFPSSLMLGYRAKYASGNIRIDTQEIEDARWFDVSQLPILPPESSIARKMIDSHISQFSQLCEL